MKLVRDASRDLARDIRTALDAQSERVTLTCKDAASRILKLLKDSNQNSPIAKLYMELKGSDPTSATFLKDLKDGKSPPDWMTIGETETLKRSMDVEAEALIVEMKDAKCFRREGGITNMRNILGELVKAKKDLAATYEKLRVGECGDKKSQTPGAK